MLAQKRCSTPIAARVCACVVYGSLAKKRYSTPTAARVCVLGSIFWPNRGRVPLSQHASVLGSVFWSKRRTVTVGSRKRGKSTPIGARASRSTRLCMDRYFGQKEVHYRKFGQKEVKQISTAEKPRIYDYKPNACQGDRTQRRRAGATSRQSLVVTEQYFTPVSRQTYNIIPGTWYVLPG